MKKSLEIYARNNKPQEDIISWGFLLLKILNNGKM